MAKPEAKPIEIGLGVIQSGFIPPAFDLFGTQINVAEVLKMQPLTGATGESLALTVNTFRTELPLPERLKAICHTHSLSPWEKLLLGVIYHIITDHRLTRALSIRASGADRSGFQRALDSALRSIGGDNKIHTFADGFISVFNPDQYFHVAGHWVSEDGLFQSSGPTRAEAVDFFYSLGKRLPDGAGIPDLLHVLKDNRELLPWQIFVLFLIVQKAESLTDGEYRCLSNTAGNLVSNAIAGIIQSRVDMIKSSTSEETTRTTPRHPKDNAIIFCGDLFDIVKLIELNSGCLKSMLTTVQPTAE